MELPPPVHQLALGVQQAGGRLYVVGGSVRDHLLGLEAKDLDLEVHGLGAGDLLGVLSDHGTARRVGRSFPVFKLALPGLPELDVALPRRDEGAPATLAEAARHRDLTINALLYDPLTAEVIDPWGGREDLAARRLRAVDPRTFAQDPVRALRVAVFAARLGAAPDPSLAALCNTLDLSQVPPERIGLELRKLWLRAPEPGRGLALLAPLGLAAEVLPGVSLDSERLAAVDRAAAMRDALEVPGPGPICALSWATLLRGVVRPALPLDRAGVRSLLRWQVRDHVLAVLGRGATLPDSDPALRALSDRLPVWLALRAAAAWEPAGRALVLLDRARWLGVDHSPLPVLLQGRDLLALGVEPGPAMGALLQDLRAAQHAGRVHTPGDARTWAQRRIGCGPAAAEDEPP